MAFLPAQPSELDFHEVSQADADIGQTPSPIIVESHYESLNSNLKKAVEYAASVYVHAYELEPFLELAKLDGLKCVGFFSNPLLTAKLIGDFCHSSVAKEEGSNQIYKIPKSAISAHISAILSDESFAVYISNAKEQADIVAVRLALEKTLESLSENDKDIVELEFEYPLTNILDSYAREASFEYKEDDKSPSALYLGLFNPATGQSEIVNAAKGIDQDLFEGDKIPVLSCRLRSIVVDKELSYLKKLVDELDFYLTRENISEFLEVTGLKNAKEGDKIIYLAEIQKVEGSKFVSGAVEQIAMNYLVSEGNEVPNFLVFFTKPGTTVAGDHETYLIKRTTKLGSKSLRTILRRMEKPYTVVETTLYKPDVNYATSSDGYNEQSGAGMVIASVLKRVPVQVE